jgi:hypothetical protein
MPRQRWLGKCAIRIELWVDGELKKDFRTDGERLYRDRAHIRDYYQNMLKKKKWEIYIIAIINE